MAEGMSILRKAPRYYRTLRAIGESYSVTWLGLLMYEIASVAPKGRVTVRVLRECSLLDTDAREQTDLDVGRVMGTILPTFFVSLLIFRLCVAVSHCDVYPQGISQCLVIIAVAHNDESFQYAQWETVRPHLKHSASAKHSSGVIVHVDTEVFYK